MSNQAEVYFRLSGDDIDPNEVTSYLGLTPSESKRKGEGGRYNPKLEYSYWKFSSGKKLDDIIDVYEMASRLVAQLSPATERIIEISAKYKLTACLQVVLTITTDQTKSTPAIGFDVAVIKFLSAVGASIDVDTYRD
jgi:hypothetical protein